MAIFNESLELMEHPQYAEVKQPEPKEVPMTLEEQKEHNARWITAFSDCV